VRCDHTIEDDVAGLFARVLRDQGRLDLLVNKTWGGHERFTGVFEASFREDPMESIEVAADWRPRHGPSDVPSAIGGGALGHWNAQPRWSHDGRKIHYLAPNRKLMEVSLEFNGQDVSAGTPRELLQTHVGLRDRPPRAGSPADDGAGLDGALATVSQPIRLAHYERLIRRESW